MTSIEAAGDGAPQCHLIAGKFATSLQIFIGATAMGTLIYKRYTEHPRRYLDIWLMDVSKQVFSSALVHFWNIGLSILITSSFLTDSGDIEGDECSFYFLNFLCDTVLGVFIIWILLKVLKRIAFAFRIEALKHQGYYGDPPQVSRYLQQLLGYLFLVFISKLVMALMMLSVRKSLIWFGALIFSPVRMTPDVELVIVMVVCPCFLNMIQYWLQDNFLMDDTVDRQRQTYALLEGESEDELSFGAPDEKSVRQAFI